MWINYKFFIICFFTIIRFCKSEDLLEFKANNISFNDTNQLSSYYLGYYYSDSICSAIYMRCVDNECKCAPNYKYNVNTNECEYFRCNSSSKC